MRTKKAVLLDFDGTIVDSQPIIDEFMDNLYARKNIHLTEDEKFVTAGMSIRDFAVWLQEHKGVELTPEEITVSDPEYLERIDMFPGAKATLALLKARGYKTALVTNSPRNYVNWLLDKYNMHPFFDTTITEDEALAPKPDPRMLEMACQDLKTEHQNCVMVDDNLPGIVAGELLSMITVRVGKKEKASFSVTRFTEVPELLESLSTPQ